ncbi:MAG: leucine-rich repeat protein, partial [Lachnospiraceae bacterium]|nr:leucine-rich repeat protein [Lachnospiraceae bacterium]
MRKRILAILLAGLMVFDSQSITALAVEPETAVVAETSVTESESQEENERETEKQTEAESPSSETDENESSEAPESPESSSESSEQTEEPSQSESSEAPESSESSSESSEQSEAAETESSATESSEEESSEVTSSESETESETETEEETEESTEEALLGEVSGDFEYSLSGNEVTITKYTGSDENVVVPETIDGNKVVSIGYRAFRYNYDVKTIKLPDTVTSIDTYAFYDCTSLTSVTLSENLTSIGNYAFYGCTSLTGVTLPANLTSIGSYAFYRCTSLTGVILPANLTSIGSSAFRYCTSLTEITLPASLTTVGSYAFANCEALKDIVFSDSAARIGSYAFANCGAIETVDIKNNNTIDDYCFSNCTGITDIIIGDHVTLEDYIFNGCNNIKNIKIGQDLTKTDNSFKGIKLGGTCGSDLSWKLDLDQGSLEIAGNGAMTVFASEADVPWCNFVTFIKKLSIGSGVTTISPYAFKNFDSIESIVLSRNVTSVGDEAFYSCDNLKNVEVSASVKSIGKSAFGECNALTKIVFCGDAPTLGTDCIPDRNTLTAYYPETATGWNDRLLARFPNVNWQVWDNTLPSKDVVLVLDTSGSMSSKMNTLKEAASRFVEAVGGTMYNTRISIVQYNSSASVLSEFSTDKDELLSKISMLRSSGGTEYARALNQADSVMQQSTARYRCIVMFSDGEPNDSKDQIRSLAARLGQSYYMYTVGLVSNSSSGESQRQILVDVAGSEDRYFEASDIDSLVEAFLALADDLAKSEDTIVEIKRHNERRDILKNQEAFCVNSPETVSIYVTPGTKFTDVKKIVLEQGGQELLTSETGWFENIVPGSLFAKGQKVSAKLYDSKKNLLDTVTLKIDMRDYFVITYKLNGETDQVYTTQNVINGEEITAPEKPTLAGYVFKGWYSSKACTGMTFFDVKNSNNRLEIEDDQTLYAKWKVGQDSLDLTTDVWHFTNSATNFCDANYYSLSEKEQNKFEYEISSGDYAKLMSGLHWYNFIQKARVKSSKKDSWGGSCFGMSASVCAAKDEVFDVSHFDANAADIASASIVLNANGDSDVGSVESMINYYYLMQVVGNIHNVRTDFSNSNESKNIKAIVNKLENTKKPAVLCIKLIGKGDVSDGGH